MSEVRIIGKNLPNIPFEERRFNDGLPVWRYSGNPIIRRNPVEGISRVFNSAVVPYKGKFIGLFRTEETTGLPFLRLGRSDDGINFTLENEPLRIFDKDGTLCESTYQFDPRLVELEGEYYAIWCGSSDEMAQYPCLEVAKTKDFIKFVRIDAPLLPPTRNGVFFPRKVGGEYIFISRPSDLGETRFGDIFMSRSKDMEYWGKHSLLLSRIPFPQASWQKIKIGAGPAPIETSEGWLLFYHGVTETCNGWVYSMGAAILDIDNPAKVKYNCKRFLQTPETDYETVGFVPKVVFPCAALTDAATGKIAIYYGAADTVVGLAFTTISEVMGYIKKHSI